MEQIRIALMDKNDLFRGSLESLLNQEVGLSVILCSAKTQILYERLVPGTIDLIIVDIAKMEEDEWKQLGKIIHDFPEIRCMALTEQIDSYTLQQLLNIRLHVYFSKNTNPLQLTQAIVKLCKSNHHSNAQMKFGPGVEQKLIHPGGFHQKWKENLKVSFSPRELQILRLICWEHSNEEIALKLEISVRTVESHRRRMIKKTKSRDIVGVLLYAINMHTNLT